MLAAERQNEILKLVRAHSSVRTNELSQSFKCEEETIRRDLDKLTANGLLKRSHGGAIAIDERPARRHRTMRGPSADEATHHRANYLELCPC